MAATTDFLCLDRFLDLIVEDLTEVWGSKSR